MMKSLAAALMLLPMAVAGQNLVGDRETVALDSPEGWAMSYAVSTTLFHGLAVPDRTEPWRLAVSVELGHIPRIDAEKQRVGFDGTKLEDLNKSPVFGRGRVAVGLPADLTLEFAYTPPMSIDGVRASGIYGLALSRPLWIGERFRIGGRLFAQTGDAHGDITCSREVAALGLSDPANNPFGCRAPSDDEIDLDHHGLELSAAWQRGGWSPFLAVSIQRLEPEVQINAPVFLSIDRTRLVTEGTRRSLVLGAERRRGPWFWSVAMAWTPLEVRRPPEFGATSDDLFSLRLLLGRDLHRPAGD